MGDRRHLGILRLCDGNEELYGTLATMSADQLARVALVIPNYFDGDTILETLESVDESEPVEVIVVDDASPDPTFATSSASTSPRPDQSTHIAG